MDADRLGTAGTIGTKRAVERWELCVIKRFERSVAIERLERINTRR
jgi:hypothetical protein